MPVWPDQQWSRAAGDSSVAAAPAPEPLVGGQGLRYSIAVTERRPSRPSAAQQDYFLCFFLVAVQMVSRRVACLPPLTVAVIVTFR